MSTETFNRVVVHPSRLSILPPAAGALLLGIFVEVCRQIAGIENIFLMLNFQAGTVRIVLPIGLLIFLVLLVRPIIRLFDSVFIIGSHHLYVITGRISLRMNHTEVPYEYIRGVRFNQTIIDRMFNIGEVIVWTAAAKSPAISLPAVPNPKRITDLIAEHIDAARMKAQLHLDSVDHRDRFKASRVSRLQKVVTPIK